MMKQFLCFACEEPALRGQIFCAAHLHMQPKPKPKPTYDQLMAFANTVIDRGIEYCDLDSADLVDIAEENGLLVEVVATEKCGDSCECSMVGDFPQSCYRKTYDDK